MDKFQKELVETIKKFRNKKILIIGDVFLDSFIFGKVSRVNPERPGYPLLKVEKDEYRLGGAANVAINVRALGAKVTLIGRVGKDRHGIIFQKICKKSKINFISIFEGKTILKQRWIESTHNDYFGRADFGENEIKDLSSKKKKYLLKSIKKQSPDAIILSDYNKGVFSEKLSQFIIDWANQNQIPTVVDPKPNNWKAFINSTLIRPNLKEAKEILGKNYESASLESIVKDLKTKMNSQKAIVTCGSKGMVSFDKFFNQIPTISKEVVDVTGAGDTAVAAIALSLSTNADLEIASNIANIASGIVIEKIGTSSASYQELINRIQKTNLYIR